MDLYLLINPKTQGRRLMLVRELDGDPSQKGHVVAHTRDRSRTYSPATYAEHVAPYARRRFVLDPDAAALVRCADADVISYQEALAKLEEARPRLLKTPEERAREREATGRLAGDCLRAAQEATRRVLATTETRAPSTRERAA